MICTAVKIALGVSSILVNLHVVVLEISNLRTKTFNTKTDVLIYSKQMLVENHGYRKATNNKLLLVHYTLSGRLSPVY